MQMGFARESGLPGKADRLADLHLVTNLDQRPIGLEMVIIGECSIRVLDDDVVAERFELRVRAAEPGIVAHSDHTTFARGTYGSAFGHIPVDRVLAPGTNEVTVGPARSLHHDIAPGAERHRIVSIVVSGVPPAAVLPMVIVMVVRRLRPIGYL